MATLSSLVVAAHMLVAAAQQLRSTVSFDYGWKVQVGASSNTSGAVCTLSYPYNLSGYACDGLISVPATTQVGSATLHACFAVDPSEHCS